MRWPDHAIWWHVYPLGFLGAERTARPPDAPVEHRLPRLANWLDYLIDLGCNGLVLGPVFAAETHGYDTIDHFRVDSRLGSEADLLRLTEQASERGVRIVLDGVFNHVARSFPYDSWLRRGPDGECQVFEGHRHLVTLDHTNPEVANYVADVMNYWVDRGIAGWRLDAAYAVPLDFWRTVANRVRTRHPNAWLFGEVIHGDYDSYVTKGGLDSVTQYELWKAIWSSLNDRNCFELAWALDRHNAVLDTFAPYTFVGNHDVTRLASRLRDERHLEHALVVLFTVGGVPSVYAGDEQAFRGVKEQRAGGDDAIRPSFPHDPSGLSEHGQWCYRTHQSLIGLRRRHPWLVRARTEIVHLTNQQLAYRVSDPSGNDGLTILLNLADEPYSFEHAADVAVHGEVVCASEPRGNDRLEVPAHGWSIRTV